MQDCVDQLLEKFSKKSLKHSKETRGVFFLEKSMEEILERQNSNSILGEIPGKIPRIRLFLEFSQEF